MFQSFRKIIIAYIFILIPTYTYAGVTTWQIVPHQSSITFTVSQNNAPITGEFKNFAGNISFDPNQLNKCTVRIIVDTGSVSTSDRDISDMLITADWLNVKVFPQAVFNANNFVRTGNNSYLANGRLTIWNKTLPVKVTFMLDQYTQDNAKAKGTMVLKRNDFGIGQGDWSDINVIKNDVQVNFKICAITQ